MGGGWSTARPGRFTLGKDGIHFIERCVDSRAGLDGFGKPRPPPGFDSLIVQPAESRYTE